VIFCKKKVQQELKAKEKIKTFLAKIAYHQFLSLLKLPQKWVLPSIPDISCSLSHLLLLHLSTVKSTKKKKKKKTEKQENNKEKNNKKNKGLKKNENMYHKNKKKGNI